MGAWNDRLLMLELISQSYYITPRGLQGVKKDGFFRYDETPNLIEIGRASCRERV